MQEMAEAFEAEYGVPVTVEEVSHTDTGGRLAQDGPAGVGADVIAAPHDHTGNLVASGLVVENAFAERMHSDMIESAVAAVSLDGVVYGYPRAIETYALYYNKDILPEPPATYAELLEWGKSFTDVNDNKYAFFMEAGNAYYVQSFLAGGGGYVFGNGGTDATDVGLDSEGAIAGVKQWLALKELLPIAAADANWATEMGLFGEGKVATMINGPWALSDVRASGVNYGVAKLPALEEGAARPFSGVRSLFVSAYSEYPNAAQLFANFYTSDENLVKRYEKTGQIPTHKAASEMEALKTDADAMAFSEQAQDAIAMPVIPEVQLFWGPMGAMYQSIWNGEISVEDGLKQAADQVRADIAAQE